MNIYCPGCCLLNAQDIPPSFPPPSPTIDPPIPLVKVKVMTSRSFLFVCLLLSFLGGKQANTSTVKNAADRETNFLVSVSREEENHKKLRDETTRHQLGETNTFLLFQPTRPTISSRGNKLTIGRSYLFVCSSVSKQRCDRKINKQTKPV